MAGITSVVLKASEPETAAALASSAFGVGDRVGSGAAREPGTGFRGFTLSLVVSGPSTVDHLVGAALEHGATPLKPVKKSFWGYGGVVEGPDRTIWKVASSSKQETGRPSTDVDDLVLLLGVADVKASKRFYAELGFVVKKGFGGKYAEFERSTTGVTLALLRRDALAKDAGVPADGAGPHGVVIRGDAGAFTDPDGFVWESAP